MRVLIGIAVIVGVILAVFYFLGQGDLGLVSGGGSEEERSLNRLQGEFRNAARAYRQAARAFAVSGVDSTHDAEAALTTLAGVEKEIRNIKKNTESEEVRAKADKLLQEIAQYRRDIE